jgi:prophage regulatory protein
MSDDTITILRRKDVQARTGLPISSLYSLVAVGAFPQPIQLSTRRVGWLESEVQAWLEERVAKRTPAHDQGSTRGNSRGRK